MPRFLLILSLVSTAVSTSALSTNPGISVNKIPVASQIHSWKVIDQSRVIIAHNEAGGYLLTLRHVCHELPFTRHLGVSSSNDTIYAGFDYITAGSQQCPIQGITYIGPLEQAALVKS